MVFNMLAYAKRLEAAGVDSKQAAAHAEAMAEVFDERTATKADITESNNTLRADIAKVHNELKAKIAEVRNELKTDIEKLSLEVKCGAEKNKSDLIRWTFSALFIQAAFIISVLKFIH